MKLSQEAKDRVSRALAYAKSQEREAYTNQVIENSRDDIASIMKKGITSFVASGKSKETCDILMEN